MSESSFVHLHLHTDYSTLDGATRIKAAVQRAAEFEMPAMAITDHGVLYGAVEFHNACKTGGIRPIIGCEVYVAPDSHLNKKASSQKEASFHLTLLAENAAGYRNLVKLVSIAHLDGVYYKPRIDKELLARHREGIIGLSGCLKGEIPYAIQGDQIDKARALTAAYRDILGPENFFLEMHDHGIEAQGKVNAQLVQFSREFGLDLVACNDVHFLDVTDHEAHNALICIGTGSNIADENRLHYVTEVYLKSPAEMRALFRDHPEACDNTLRIAERCGFDLDTSTKYPNFQPPEGKSQTEHLRDLAEAGMRERYGAHWTDAEIHDRFRMELNVLETQGFTNYFLIVWDFIHWARQQGIPVGPGRGSAAGSIIAYAIGITDVDPIQYKLLFERFLNPERVSPPDIDVDFCQSRRGEVIDYVKRKYGERAVAQIITFGTLGAKSVVRDVGRVLGWGYSDADRIAKMIPSGPGNLNLTLAGFSKKDPATGEVKHEQGAVDKNSELADAIKNEPATADLWRIATKLEGLTRNVGVHAAGVVIGAGDLSDHIPLTRSNDGGIVSQYEGNALGELGMLKMDFLGLKTLTVIHDALTLIHRKEPDFNIKTIPLDDAAVFELLNRAEVVGLFQLDGGMATWCKSFDFHSIDDVIALNALYRPGPMDLLPDFIKRKKGQTPIKHAHPLLETVTAETYGLMIYQEQVMAATQVMAGYTLGGADNLRRAMGKKDREKMAKEREKFIKGCAEVNNIGAAKANEIFDLLEKFAGYGFNKSHSAAYGWISYQTAYLKAHYPVDFMAAVLSNEINNTDKLSTFIAECQRLGLFILPPDVNRSDLLFTPEMLPDGRKGIRFGLAAIKNVGEAAMAAAIAERVGGGDYQSIEDFCSRLGSRTVNRKILESLIRGGAFDFTQRDRAELFARVDSALSAAQAAQKDRASGQVSLFDAMELRQTAPSVPETISFEPWTQLEKLAFEKELLGFYVTGHPLDDYRDILDSGPYVTIVNLPQVEDRSSVKLAGILTSVDTRYSKKDNKPFAFVQLEDLTGTIEVRVWSEAFLKVKDRLTVGNVVAITGRIGSRDEGVPNMTANDVVPLTQGKTQRALRLFFPSNRGTPEELLEVRDHLLRHPGSRPVDLEFEMPAGRRARLRTGSAFRVNLTDDLKRALAPWLPV